MQLTLFSDYSLRVLLYLATHPRRPVSVQEIAKAYRISRHHLLKVTRELVRQGLVASARGRGGGLKLQRSPGEINVGSLVRQTEPHWNLVECFDPLTNTCPIAPVCGLKDALFEARGAFFASLDEYTLADFVPRRKLLQPYWDAALNQR